MKVNNNEVLSDVYPFDPNFYIIKESLILTFTSVYKFI